MLRTSQLASLLIAIGAHYGLSANATSFAFASAFAFAPAPVAITTNC